MEPKFILETQALSHRFADGSAVLRNINLQVPEGAIYGFLGPNGAGKTTTLRLVLGLLKKQEGRVVVFNRDFDDHRIEVLSKTGTLIESPSIYGHLTAEENLEVLQKIYQCPTGRIKIALEMVGLAETGKKKAGRFSFGMKQRLSIAMALLHEPDLLVLDEPTNGLDPNGMIEVRDLLKGLNKRYGITIVISSHLLSEIEKMATHVGILHQGELKFQGSLAELQDQRISSSRIAITISDPDKGKAHLARLNYATAADGSVILLPLVQPEAVGYIVRELVLAGLDIYAVSHTHDDLEAIFMDMIK